MCLNVHVQAYLHVQYLEFQHISSCSLYIAACACAAKHARHLQLVGECVSCSQECDRASPLRLRAARQQFCNCFSAAVCVTSTGTLKAAKAWTKLPMHRAAAVCFESRTVGGAPIVAAKALKGFMKQNCPACAVSAVCAVQHANTAGPHQPKRKRWPHAMNRFTTEKRNNTLDKPPRGQAGHIPPLCQQLMELCWRCSMQNNKW